MFSRKLLYPRIRILPKPIPIHVSVSVLHSLFLLAVIPFYVRPLFPVFLCEVAHQGYAGGTCDQQMLFLINGELLQLDRLHQVEFAANP